MKHERMRGGNLDWENESERLKTIGFNVKQIFFFLKMKTDFLEKILKLITLLICELC